MLKIKGIHKSFGELEILKGVDLTLHKGDINVVLGQSGSGKTTLLRCIDFLEKPDAGEITIGDIHADYKKVSEKTIIEIRRKMSFVFQSYGLFRNKNALENVMLGLTAVRKISKNEAKDMAIEAIEKVGLADRLDHYPSQLSGGQQQRIGIARAIVTNPDVILMDEPTSSLDPGLVGEVLQTITKLAEDGATMIIVTHELEFARKVSTKATFMHQGQIIESNDTEKFFFSPRDERVLNFLRNSSMDYDFNI